jgi:integrase/recombinase XerD
MYREQKQKQTNKELMQDKELKINEFKTHLLMLGYVPSSAKGRSNNLKEFLNFTKKEIEQIEKEDITNYYEYLKERPNKNNGCKLSPKTIYNQMRSIELFFSMLQETQSIENHPFANLKFKTEKPKSSRNILTQSEIQELYQATTSDLERVILSLAYGCGLRVGELVKVNTNHIQLRENILVVPSGKYNKKRIIPISSGVKKDIENYYYKVRIYIQSIEIEAFILNNHNKRMKSSNYNHHLKQMIERTENPKIQLKNITMHCLRHSIATHLLEQKIPLEQVRDFLGHAQLESTEIYTRISQKQLNEL